MIGSIATKDSALIDKFMTNLSREALIKAIDSFYLDTLNENIFIVHALQLVKYHVEGLPKSKIDHCTEMYRKLDVEGGK